MKLIGNILWILFGGFLLALEYFFLGLFWCITIIGIPLGLQLFKIAGLSLWPFGRVVRPKQQAVGCLSTGMNIVWFLLGGLLIALEHAIIGLLFCITIIGIPFGKQHFKLAAIALTPFGHEITSAKKVRRQDQEGQEDATTGETITTEEETVEEETSSPVENIANVMNAIPEENRKWYYLGGGAVAVLAVIIGIFTCSDSKKNSGEFAGKPISELFPEVAKVADAGTIPDEAITYIWDNSQGEECVGDVTIVRKADENQMVVMYETTSCDANTLRLGVYQNGQYVFYYEILIGGIDYEEAKSGMMLKNNPPESIIYYGYYGQDCAKTIEHEWGTETAIDWDKITETQLAEIFAAAISEGPKEPFIITANFIKEAKSQNIEASVEEAEIENPAITEQLDEFERAIAEVNDRVERHQTSGSIVDSDICNGVQEMHNGLAEARGEMSEGQQIRFDQLVEKANQLYEFAERIRQANGPAEAEAVDSVMLE